MTHLLRGATIAASFYFGTHQLFVLHDTRIALLWKLPASGFLFKTVRRYFELQIICVLRLIIILWTKVVIKKVIMEIFVIIL